MHVDNILGGKKLDDIIKDREKENERIIKEKESKYQNYRHGRGLATINED